MNLAWQDEFFCFEVNSNFVCQISQSDHQHDFASLTSSYRIKVVTAESKR